MTPNRTTHMLLLLIASALIAIAAAPLLRPTPVAAQTGNNDPFYFEPGVYLLRIPNAGGQVLGKVVVNLHTGVIWGFPTNNSDPYPTSPLDSKQQVSHPIMLGKFALSEAAGH
ncbi:MAG: hypothetical protein ACRYF4_10350 [Janthinobacterium lividum]